MSWMPGINHDPGRFANYEQGRVRKQAVKLHYTVGVNSTGKGKQGFFQFLVPRAGVPTQFAPSDAVNWDSGVWNDAGPGIEFEYYPPNDGPPPANIVTQSQIEWGGKIIHWLAQTDGYPLSFYDGPRITEASGFRGFITHRSLVQKEAHSDYITYDQWNAMVGGLGDDDVLTKDEHDMLIGIGKATLQGTPSIFLDIRNQNAQIITLLKQIAAK